MKVTTSPIVTNIGENNKKHIRYFTSYNLAQASKLELVLSNNYKMFTKVNGDKYNEWRKHSRHIINR